MKTVNNNPFNYKASISAESLMYMEKYEHNHLNQIYESKMDSLECWAKESNYLDSEFSNMIEKKEHVIFYGI